MNFHVIKAIFRRNFVSYFSNPTGYVFICGFVLASSLATFWPNEFFNANLANLDQLNRFLPYLMLVFIPAITMSIWADERRQGTDELLLTIPASDLDVVIGKYLAAVAIFTVSLFFSLSNIAFLAWLGVPDIGLLLGTYFGYWMVGLAMLAIGMVASFLTNNLTVGFVLGVTFNAPLAFATSADVIFSQQTAQLVKSWSIGEQFRDFGRGVISLSGVAYFLGIVLVMLYLSMILIGRRHWKGGPAGAPLRGHYFLRGVALIVLVAGLNVLVSRHDVRLDVTSERLSSLSSQSRELLTKLDAKRPVHIDAYISPNVPEAYVQTRLNLLSILREFGALSGGKISVTVNPTERFSPEAARAEQQYSIKSQQVPSRNRGSLSLVDIFMAVAITSGLDRVVVPFFDRGIPVEYELVRSIATVAQQQRKKMGILTTDAKLYGGFDMQSMSQSRNELIIDELEKQYDVVQVSPDAPLKERYDVLLAVQPSSLTPEQMENFVAAVKSGQPTAIFEDPFPYLDPSVPATSAPKRPPGGMNPFMGGGQQPPQPKGDIARLWGMLGVDFDGQMIVWQDYNPFPKIGQFPREFVFVGAGSGQEKPFEDENEISSKLQQMLFLFPGSLRRQNVSELEFEALVMTGQETGTVAFSEILEQSIFGMGGGLNPARHQVPTRQEYVLAAHIRGKLPQDGKTLQMSDEGYEVAQAEQAAQESTAETPADEPATADVAAEESKPAEHAANEEAAASEPSAGDSNKPAEDSAGTEKAQTVPPNEAEVTKPGELNVVLVADIDVLYSAFFALRARGDDPEAEVNLNLDNVTFVLNALDMLAGDERFVEVRKRRPQHRTLTRVEQATETAREDATKAAERFRAEFNKAQQEAQAKFDQDIDNLKKEKNVDPQEQIIKIQVAEEGGRKQLEAKTEQLKQKRDRDIEKIETQLAMNVAGVQNWCKFWAVILPPIPPLLIGVFVLLNRRAHEREGVAGKRLR